MWELVGEHWRSGPVAVAVGPVDRLVGLTPVGRTGLLLRARSIHTVGMLHPLVVVPLRGTVVVGSSVVPPGTVFADRRASAILELPPWRDRPPEGLRLAARRIR